MTKRFVGLRYRSAVFAALLLLTPALLGCDTEKTRNLVDERAGEAQQSLVTAREQQPNAKPYNPLVVTDKIYEGNAATRMHRGLPLPARYETSRGITIISGQPLPLVEIADAITSQTGIPVRIPSGDASRSRSNTISPLSAASGTTNPVREPNISGANPSGSGASAPAANTSNFNNSSSSSGEMLVSYEGPLSGLLERVAGYFDASWRYDGSTIVIERYETRVFLVEALPGTATTSDASQGSASTGSSGGSSGGSGGSSGSSGASSAGSSSSSGSSGGSSGGTITGSLTQSVNYNGTIKYWEELKETLTAMLKGDGSIITTPSSGEVTVTARPEIMKVIADYLAQENKRLSRQIAINVSVYNVSLARDSDFDVSFGAAIGKIGNIANITNISNQATPTSVGPINALGTLTLGIINPNHTNGVGKLNDVFSALSTVGDTTTVAQFPVTTLNNRPVSRFVGTTEYFVPQLQSNTLTGTASSSSTTATAQPITSGITLQMTPRLLEDGRIILQYSLNIQNITSIQCFNTCTGVSATCGSTSSGNAQGGCVIQEPITTNRSFIQQSVLRSGSMLVIGGVDEEDVEQNSNGVGDPFNWLLGGGTSNATGRTMVFIAIAPQVLDPPSAEQGL